MQNRFKIMALGVFALVVTAGLTFAASGKFSAKASKPETAVVEDADYVKRSIVELFSSAPDAFVLRSVSRRLADARLDGFAVCTPIDEATAAQYVEVAAMIDKATIYAPEFMKIVNVVMDSDAGMNDCDYRIISLIARVTTRG